MKREYSTFLFVAILLAMIMLACTDKQNSYVGEWKGSDENGKAIALIFDKGGYATLILGNEVIGGKMAKVGERTLSMKYSFDTTHSPAWLDLIVYNEADQKEFNRLKTIVRFIGDNKLQFMANAWRAERPSNFDNDNEDVYVLSRT